LENAVLVKVDHFYLSNTTAIEVAQLGANYSSTAIVAVGHEEKSTVWAVKVPV